jgi:hypothetical protein
LHGAADALRIFRNKKRTGARRDTFGNAAPERAGALARQRMHETDRRACFDAVDQHVHELIDLRVVNGVQPPQGPGAHAVKSRINGQCSSLDIQH